MKFFRRAARRADAMEAAAIARYDRRRELSTAVAAATRVADAVARLEAALRSDQRQFAQPRNGRLTAAPVPIPIDDPTSYRDGHRR